MSLVTITNKDLPVHISTDFYWMPEDKLGVTSFDRLCANIPAGQKREKLLDIEGFFLIISKETNHATKWKLVEAGANSFFYDYVGKVIDEDFFNDWDDLTMNGYRIRIFQNQNVMVKQFNLDI